MVCRLLVEADFEALVVAGVGCDLCGVERVDVADDTVANR
jgi:hypothetical protein